MDIGIIGATGNIGQRVVREAVGRGQPLRSLDVMLAFIRGTTTASGLTVEMRLDNTIYRKGRKATDKQLQELAVFAHDVCPRWNYTFAPRVVPSR
jgi:Rhodopirellula transposase DDE domain